ncbi:unnamed protein product [Phyllotreta striolata]|uniref:Cysteine/serine-rich nuclear protein N-terminal domain-containing protein n=1 Tax=Phyllotreta striolata TaxID=444603 RepID=A0A9N9XSF2_PHYSR|nr:unnamed protein product [Phyllotreta striolata]
MGTNASSVESLISPRIAMDNQTDSEESGRLAHDQMQQSNDQKQVHESTEHVPDAPQQSQNQSEEVTPVSGEENAPSAAIVADPSEQKSNDKAIAAGEPEIAGDGDDSATESLPPTEELIEEPHDRSDGSDSGLGSELSEERPPEMAAIESSFLYGTLANAHFDEFAALQPAASKKSSLKRKAPADAAAAADEPETKKRKGITFDSVTVFYFPRAQGFTCVPSQGGSTLGMGAQHSHVRKFSISEHATEQRRIHRQLLQQLKSERNVTSGTGTSSDESDSEDEISEASDTEVDPDNYHFLQPVPTRQRRALLRAAGVRKIDAVEKDDCRTIRTSREFCGCGCKGYCDPDTCSCSQAGIKCQVDRLNFPCGCSRDNCGNSSGRIEFNPVRVRTHFIHTLMRLELEKEKEEKSDNKEACPSWMDNERLLGVLESGHAPAKAPSKYNNNLLRDVPLATNVEAENCVHTGSFTNLHYGAPGEGPGQLPDRADSLDLYTFRETCYSEDNGQEDRNQPGFLFSNVGFSNYTPPQNHYGQQSYIEKNPVYQGFSEFSPIFNPYANMYVPEFAQKPLECGFQQPPPAAGAAPFGADAFAEPKGGQYASLSPVASSGKVESFSELLSGRYGAYPAYEGEFSGLGECQQGGEKGAERPAGADEADENFGEIIKKSMVESVSA